jgi:hypothetical protein
MHVHGKILFSGLLLFHGFSLAPCSRAAILVWDNVRQLALSLEKNLLVAKLQR